MNRKDVRCVQFGQLVRRLREAAGLSQEDFAARAGVHRTYIGGIERGERNPTLTTIYRLARALRVSPARLFEESSNNQ